MSGIYLYAEILANIRQVSLYASLQTDKDEETTIDVSSDRRIVTVSAGDDRASIFLPTGIGGDASVDIPTTKKKEISIRLEIGDVAGLPFADELKCLNEYPWLATDLQPETQLRCKLCEQEFVKSGDIATWKDLPSEGWADMMDLWHCHKPQTEHTSSDGVDVAQKNGYSSTSRLNAARHTGLVDIYSFLFDRQDCNSVQVCYLRNNLCAGSCCVTFLSLAVTGEKKETFPALSTGIDGLVADTNTPDQQTRSCSRCSILFSKTDFHLCGTALLALSALSLEVYWPMRYAEEHPC